MLSSIMVSFVGGFPLSFAVEDEGCAASLCFGSASAGADWLVVSGRGLDFWVLKHFTGDFGLLEPATVDFWVLKPAPGAAALGTCAEPNSSATSFWN